MPVQGFFGALHHTSPTLGVEAGRDRQRAILGQDHAVPPPVTHHQCPYLVLLVHLQTTVITMASGGDISGVKDAAEQDRLTLAQQETIRQNITATQVGEF